jgi:2-phospho-L-lactate guanylyltransferase (CobY/MobA/RfbA family)
MPAAGEEPVPAIVLAGGRPGREFALAAGVPNAPGARALAAIDGQPMVRFVLRALRQARSTASVLLVAPAGFPRPPEAERLVTADGDLAQNIRVGIAACGGAEHVLIATSDIPYLTPEAVDAFVALGRAAGADCCVAAIPRGACDRAFPGARRTFVRLSGRRVTAGNLVFQRAATYEKQAAILQAAHRRRKNPLVFAQLIGARNALRLAAGTLRVEHVERAASRLLDVRCRVLITDYAEIGTDVDRPADLAMARERLRW